MYKHIFYIEKLENSSNCKGTIEPFLHDHDAISYLTAVLIILLIICLFLYLCLYISIFENKITPYALQKLSILL